MVEALADERRRRRGAQPTTDERRSRGPPQNCPTGATKVRVRQKLVNLLTNAASSPSPGGRVTISGGTAEGGRRGTLWPARGRGSTCGWRTAAAASPRNGSGRCSSRSIRSEFSDGRHGTGLGLLDQPTTGPPDGRRSDRRERDRESARRSRCGCRLRPRTRYRVNAAKAPMANNDFSGRRRSLRD